MDKKISISRKNRGKNLEQPNIEKEDTKATSSFKIWKILFLLLLAFNLALVAFVGIRITGTRDSATLNQTSSTSASTNQKVATINTTTSQVNELVNSYLKKYQKDGMSYKFYISEQQAVVNIDYKILGTKVPLYLYFEPLALSDGAISLTVTSISAGTLSLPTSAILQMLKSYQLPDFVEVKSSTSQVIIHLNKLTLADNLYLKTNQIDLTNGNFTFDLMKK